jgi:hypothetical protein
MKVKVKSKDKMIKAIEGASRKENGQGGCISHVLTYEKINDQLLRLEAYLSLHGLAKKDMVGVAYIIGANSKKANAYKYRYQAMVYRFAYFPSGWFLVDCKRCDFFPNQSTVERIYTPQSAMEKMQNALLSKFVVTKEANNQ